ncbi:transcription activator effector-binding protein [Bizionia sediminis]|uniref:Transcription activator effector-binding protein n=1 Tax=Bizionia sediminis TaxID=1737064 RepID=A0ABW5KPF2_9FLAO
MKALQYLLFLILILCIGGSIYIAVQPNDYDIRRTQTILAPSEVIYTHISDLSTYSNWLPWLNPESNAQFSKIDSISAQPVAIYWSDKQETGFLEMEQTTPHKNLKQILKLPTKRAQTVTWNISETNRMESTVSISLADSSLSFFEKAKALVNGGFEKIYGQQLETTLENLNTSVISAMAVYNIEVNGITTYGGGFYLYSTTASKITDLQTTIHKVMPRLKAYVQNNNITTAGAPFVIYHNWDTLNNAVTFSCAIPTTNPINTTESDILTGQLIPFRAVKTTLYGHTNNLAEARNANDDYINQYNLQATPEGPMLEVYLTDPNKVANPANWKTELYTAIN